MTEEQLKAIVALRDALMATFQPTDTLMLAIIISLTDAYVTGKLWKKCNNGGS